jgi:phage gp16-like protein
MALSNLQYRTVHIAAKQLGLNDDQYRMVLRNVADVESATVLDNVTFEQVMATFEEQGYRDPNKPGDYWRSKLNSRSRFANERLVRRVEILSRQVRYCLPAMCEQFSNGRTQIPEKLTPGEAYKLIEMFTAVIKREAIKQSNVTEDAHVQPSLF